MQTSEKKAPRKRPEVRSLKIQAHYRDNSEGITILPEIKLCGVWLGKLGFAPKQRVHITTMNKLLIIRIEE